MLLVNDKVFQVAGNSVLGSLVDQVSNLGVQWGRVLSGAGPGPVGPSAEYTELNE